jgi:hypothetical protein
MVGWKMKTPVPIVSSIRDDIFRTVRTHVTAGLGRHIFVRFCDEHDGCRYLPLCLLILRRFEAAGAR